MIFHFLPGFLGFSQDWLSVLPKKIEKVCYDFFISPYSKAQGSPQLDERLFPARRANLEGLYQLGDWVNQYALQYASSSRVLVGYSFGGRVALHALLQAPWVWNAAILISTHFGLNDHLKLERQQRIDSDQHWAKKFLTEPFPLVVQEWNSQSVLKTSRPLLSRESIPFSRLLLSEAFTHCSLGLQEDLRPPLRKLDCPILWISGERDAKFCELATEASGLNRNFKSLVVSHSGHRVPWDQTQALNYALERVKNGKLD